MMDIEGATNVLMVMWIGDVVDYATYKFKPELTDEQLAQLPEALRKIPVGRFYPCDSWLLEVAVREVPASPESRSLRTCLAGLNHGRSRRRPCRTRDSAGRLIRSGHKWLWAIDRPFGIRSGGFR